MDFYNISKNITPIINEVVDDLFLNIKYMIKYKFDIKKIKINNINFTINVKYVKKIKHRIIFEEKTNIINNTVLGYIDTEKKTPNIYINITSDLQGLI